MRCIPEVCDPATKSLAEKRIFDLLHELEGNNFEEWYCFHSVGIAKHQNPSSIARSGKRYAELDFLLVGPPGIFGLEVKGGSVAFDRESGQWRFTSSRGESESKREGPFQQVSSAMFSIEQSIKQRFGDASFYMGMGVIFPDIYFTSDSPEWEDWPILDLGNIEEGMAKYLSSLISHWKGKTSAKKRGLSRKEIEDIKNYLRPSFEHVAPLWGKLRQIEKSRITLTEEQCRYLDFSGGNSKLVIEGGAGTGKTFLAIEQARRLAAEGKKVLFLCYNRLLSELLATELSGHANVTVSTYHGLLKTIAEEGGTLDTAKQGGDFIEALPDMFVEAMLSDCPYEKADVLILDESQDLLNEKFWENVDLLLNGGVRNGSWFLFLDSKQTMLSSDFSEAFLSKLRTDYHLPSLTLPHNCRNTKNVITVTQQLTKFELEKPKIETEGGKVKFKFFNGEKELKSILREWLAYLRNERVPFEAIDVLYPTREYGSLVETVATEMKIESRLLSSQEVCSRDSQVLYHHPVSGYKGLENSVIILIGVKDIINEMGRRQNYVAFTRARDLLFVACDHATKDVLKKSI